MGKVQWRAVFGPVLQVAFISTDQQALAFLPEVILAIPIRDGRQTAIHRVDLGDGFSNEILMLGRLQWQGDPGHCRDFTPPKPGSVHHPIGVDLALGCPHDPSAIRLLFSACDRGETMNFGAVLTGTSGISVGDARGVDVAAGFFEHDAADAVEVHQGVQRFGFGPADFVKLQTIIPRLGLL